MFLSLSIFHFCKLELYYYKIFKKNYYCEIFQFFIFKQVFKTTIEYNKLLFKNSTFLPQYIILSYYVARNSMNVYKHTFDYIRVSIISITIY